MILALDRSKPYSEVHGLPGAMFEQAGVLFKFNGAPAVDVAPFVEESIISEPYEINPPEVSCIEQPSIPSDGKTMEDMHWQHLRMLVESFGGTWSNRHDAIAFMNGKKGE